jgi:hypothetical protein
MQDFQTALFLFALLTLFRLCDFEEVRDWLKIPADWQQEPQKGRSQCSGLNGIWAWAAPRQRASFRAEEIAKAGQVWLVTSASSVRTIRGSVVRVAVRSNYDGDEHILEFPPSHESYLIAVRIRAEYVLRFVHSDDILVHDGACESWSWDTVSYLKIWE